MMKNKIKTLLSLSLIILTSCVQITFEATGVFKEPYKYTRYYDGIISPKISEIKIDEEKITFFYLGQCGQRLDFMGIILPIPLIPVHFNKNNCENEGFIVMGFTIPSPHTPTKLDYSKISYQLKYNNKIYNPEPGEVNQFKISDFSSFKEAKDKTLIIHKKTKNGSVITKELPFEWKIRMY